MGASESTHTHSAAAAAAELKQLEAAAINTGYFSSSMLENFFSSLSNMPNSSTKSIPLAALQVNQRPMLDCFDLRLEKLESDNQKIPECFQNVLHYIGQSVVELLFTSPHNNGEIPWIEFLKGLVMCCGRHPVSESLILLYKLFAKSCEKAGAASKLEFGTDDHEDSSEVKISGSFKLSELLMFQWLCWIMMHSTQISKFQKNNLFLPDIDHLLSSAAIYSGIFSETDVLSWDALDYSHEIPADKVHQWMLVTVPGIANSFSQYARDKIQAQVLAGQKNNVDESTAECSCEATADTYLLTCGRAWAISLTLRGFSSDELVNASICKEYISMSRSLLYRSTLHGKGLSRFWSSVEGYNGPSLILISANSQNTSDSHVQQGRWVIGVLAEQGFENKDTHYGRSGYLYALHPVFRVIGPSAKEKNFVYSHFKATNKVYQAHPKPVGLGFGGTVGNERVFLDEDFCRLVVRHHAVDKTYQSGALVPNQGFLAVEASIAEVEVWGLGGKTAKQTQDAYKKREVLFTEQRRKVDLKSFGSWEDSPEKMMMDMVSDPNKVQREDR